MIGVRICGIFDRGILSDQTSLCRSFIVDIIGCICYFCTDFWIVRIGFSEVEI